MVKEKSSHGATVQTLADLLKEQIESGKENHQQMLESLENIRASVSGEEDTSLLTQVTRLRTTFADKQDDLIEEFRNFAENMAEANSQKLIEALEEVMRDFNTRINEQFGDNFKHLNEGVEKLVDWQDKYAMQTETMIEQFDRTVSTIEQVRDTIEQIAERSVAITDAAEKLDPILTGIQEQRERMKEYLENFSNMSEKAQTLLPTLEAKVNELTENFSESVQKALKANQESLDEQKRFNQTVIDGFSELDEVATSAVEKISETSKQHIEHMRASVSDAEEQQKKLVSNLADRVNSLVTETFKKTEKEIVQLAQRNSESIEARMKEIDEGLAEELTKVLRDFGSRLASISARFAEDYTLLADKLKVMIEGLEADGR